VTRRAEDLAMRIDIWSAQHPPEVALHPANALFARMGSRATPLLRALFEAKL
jgi:hypothetical protein